jgi:short-subunit dehydrogenase
MKSPGSRGDLALVTGASSGIGEAFAYRLAALGYDLVITARREDRLKEVAAKIEAEHGRDVRVIVAELGNRDGLARVIDVTTNEPLNMLVNNAGLAHYKPFLELPPDEAEELVLVNTLAPTLLARAALPGMVARGSGTIINLSSMLAFSGTVIEGHLPRRAVYAATRAYMLAFSQLLQGELQGSGIYVQALCPAVVRTEFHTRQGMDLSSRPRLDPDDVVTASLVAMENGELVCSPSLEDTGLVEDVGEAQRTLLYASFSPTPAARYVRD